MCMQGTAPAHHLDFPHPVMYLPCTGEGAGVRTTTVNFKKSVFLYPGQFAIT